MKAGPIRRAAGGLGLLALVPTALMLFAGQITLQVAAVRAGITLACAMLVARAASWAVGLIVSGAGTPATAPADAPGARAAAKPAGSPPARPAAADAPGASSPPGRPGVAKAGAR